jgi:hypothetical protein
MGHRATFAIREDGEIELFYSHWGALSVPRDIFWGPEAAEEYIRANQESDGWLDDVWGEGGVGLNKDERLMSWFGGETLGYGRHRELFQELISALWAEEGWTVRAVEGMPDIAESVGVDRSVALADPVEPWAVQPEELGEQWKDAQTKSYFGLVTLLQEDGTPETMVIDCGISPFLAAGSDVLEHLEQLPRVAEVLEYHETRPPEEWEEEAGRRAPVTNYLNSGAVIDLSGRRITYFGAATSAYDLEYFSDAWGGWTITRHDEGLRGHFRRAGLETPEAFLQPQWWGGDESVEPEELTEDDLLSEIAQTLLEERSDPVEFMRRVTESLQAENDEEVWVNPDAMVSPPDAKPGDPEVIFGRALAAMMRARTERDD